MKLSELKTILRKSWTKETSADPENWTPENPAWGQCAVTALVVQDFFGGELLRAMVEIEGSNPPTQYSHYWNLLPDGREIDLTRQQFLKNKIIIKNIQHRTREYAKSFAPARKRYALLRLAVENQINPNPLFSDPIYQTCFEIAQESECQKMKFGCLVFYKEELVAKTANKIIEPLRYLCEPECIRLKIQSRTESMIGACGHAEEWALREVRQLGISPGLCSFYVAGFNAKTLKPWIKKEAKDFTCLRCAVQIYMTGIKKIWVPVIDHWEYATPKEAVEKSAAYALKEKKI